MSYAIMRIEKRNSSNIGGMFCHNERKTENHSNEDINKDLSHLNYQLIECDSYKQKINQEIKDRYTVNKSIRKDAVICAEVIFTSDKDFFDKLTPEQEKKYFEKSVEFLKEEFGEKNVVFATVHKDETTPHLHAGIVPITDDGRLSYKSFVSSKYDLIKLQDKYYEKMSLEFPELERGKSAKETQAEHLTVEEYKLQQKTVEIQQNIELQLAEINRITLELDKQKKILEAKRKEVEDEKFYNLQDIDDHVKESKSFFYKDRVTVTMSKELYKSLLKYALEGENYYDKYCDIVDKEKSRNEVVASVNREKDRKIKELSTENEKLKTDNENYKTKVAKLKAFEEVQKVLPNEMKELFDKYIQIQEQEKEKMRGRGRISRSWSNKIENDKDKGIEL